MNKKSMAGVGLLAIVGVAGLYLASRNGDDGAEGGLTAERVGNILGSPGAVSAGLTAKGQATHAAVAQRQAAGFVPYTAPGEALTAETITTQVISPAKKEVVLSGAGGLTAKGMSTKQAIAARRARGFVAYTGTGYVPKSISASQTFGKVAVAAGGGGYTPKTVMRDPTTSRIGRFQAAVIGKKEATVSKTQAGLTQKGLTTQKKAAARKKTPTSGYAAAAARAG